MASAVDLATKILGVLAALLGLAGYVLVLGATILWLRLSEVDLPTQVPVSIASQEELIALGAQAVAVWLVLVGALMGLGAWIATGDPGRRQFGYAEAGLALAVTLATLLPLETGDHWLLLLPLAAILWTSYRALRIWPSLEAVATVLLPIAVGVAMAFLLSTLGNDNHIATATGATSIFGALMLATPRLQKWRARQDANQMGVARIEAERQLGERRRSNSPRLIEALKDGGGPSRPPAVMWIGRIAASLLILVLIGAVAVASQIDRDKDFHKALVSLKNGDCIEGSYVTHGGDQIVIGQPGEDEGDEHGRISSIPAEEVLELQVYGKSETGPDLDRIEECTGMTGVMVRPAK